MHANCATVARQQPAKTRKFLAGLTRSGTTLRDQPKKVLLTTILSMTSKERRRMITSQKKRSIQMTTSKPFPNNSKDQSYHKAGNDCNGECSLQLLARTRSKFCCRIWLLKCNFWASSRTPMDFHARQLFSMVGLTGVTL